MVSGLHCYLYWMTFRGPGNPLQLPLATAYEWLISLLAWFFVGAGASAVTMFFVISGFVLRGSLERLSGVAGNIAVRFFLSRTFRIYPAAVAVIILWAICEPRLLYGHAHRSLLDIATNAVLIKADMNWPMWSNRVEIAAAPLILVSWFTYRHRGLWSFLAIAIGLTAISFVRFLYADDMIGRYLFVFVFG